MAAAAKAQAKKILKKAGTPLGQNAKLDPFQFKDLTQAEEEELAVIPSPASLLPTLTAPRDFNLMFETSGGRRRRVRCRLPPAGDGAGHLRQLQERAVHRQDEGAVRGRAGRQGLQERGHAQELHLQVQGVRAGETERARKRCERSEREKGASEASAKKS